MAMGEVTETGRLAAGGGQEGEKKKWFAMKGYLQHVITCLSLHGRTDDSFYIVTIIIIITSSQWSCSRPHPFY